MEYIAFSRHATKEFIRLTSKGTPVYYLEGDLSPKDAAAHIDAQAATNTVFIDVDVHHIPSFPG